MKKFIFALFLLITPSAWGQNVLNDFKSGDIMFSNSPVHNDSAVLRSLLNYNGLLFYKDFTALSVGMHPASDLNADFSQGDGTATFTATRSASAPATYVDGAGRIIPTTASDQARVPGGFYDTTGFHSCLGLYSLTHEGCGVMIEGSGTNLLIRTDGTDWTGWGENYKDITGTPTYSTVAIPELSSISNATATRIRYTGIAGDSNKQIQYHVANVISLSAGTYTYSMWVKSSSSGVTVKLTGNVSGGGAVYPAPPQTSTTITPTSSWARYSAPVVLSNVVDTISSIIGNGTTVTVITTANHNLQTGNTVSISGTTAFNGDTNKSITKVNNTTFSYSSSVVATESAGTVTCPITSIYLLVAATGIDNGDVVDISFANPQFEQSPYATSFIPTTTAALTRGAETLKYPIAGNRNASVESLFVRYGTMWNITDIITGQTNFLTGADTKTRNINVNATSDKMDVKPNATDNGSVNAQGSLNKPTINTPITVGAVFKHASPYAQTFENGSSISTYTVGDFTDNAWGTSFYIGSNNIGTQQLGGVLQNFTAYSTDQTSNVAAINTILSN